MDAYRNWDPQLLGIDTKDCAECKHNSQLSYFQYYSFQWMIERRRVKTRPSSRSYEGILAHARQLS